MLEPKKARDEIMNIFCQIFGGSVAGNTDPSQNVYTRLLGSPPESKTHKQASVGSVNAGQPLVDLRHRWRPLTSEGRKAVLQGRNIGDLPGTAKKSSGFGGMGGFGGKRIAQNNGKTTNLGVGSDILNRSLPFIGGVWDAPVRSYENACLLRVLRVLCGKVSGWVGLPVEDSDERRLPKSIKELDVTVELPAPTFTLDKYFRAFASYRVLIPLLTFWVLVWLVITLRRVFA